jgi:hypothetical protein
MGMAVSRTLSLGARVFLVLVLLLAAPAALAPASGDFAGLVDIGGGRKMYLECRGTGFPTVVLVAGLKGSAEDWNITKQSQPTVFAVVAKFSRVCGTTAPERQSVRNRAGAIRCRSRPRLGTRSPTCTPS